MAGEYIVSRIQHKMTHVSAIFLGDSAVGKTTFLTRACKGLYTQADIKPTLGVDNFVFRTQKDVVRCWDTSGSNRFIHVIPLFVRRCDIAVFIFDVTQPETYENISKWHTLVCKSEDAPEEMIIIALNNGTNILPSSFLDMDILDGTYPREVMKDVFRRGHQQKQYRKSFDVETQRQQRQCCFSLC